MDIPEARTVSDNTNANIANETSVLLAKTVTDALNTSVSNKTSSATISLAGKSAPDVMNVLSELKRKGYRISQSGTNMTISW